MIIKHIFIIVNYDPIYSYCIMNALTLIIAQLYIQNLKLHCSAAEIILKKDLLHLFV